MQINEIDVLKVLKLKKGAFFTEIQNNLIVI